MKRKGGQAAPAGAGPAKRTRTPHDRSWFPKALKRLNDKTGSATCPCTKYVLVAVGDQGSDGNYRHLDACLAFLTFLQEEFQIDTYNHACAVAPAPAGAAAGAQDLMNFGTMMTSEAEALSYLIVQVTLQ